MEKKWFGLLLHNKAVEELFNHLVDIYLWKNVCGENKRPTAVGSIVSVFKNILLTNSDCLIMFRRFSKYLFL